MSQTHRPLVLFVPIEKLTKNSEFWASFEAARYPFIAIFGIGAAGPFQSIREVRNRVILSAGMLIRTFGKGDEYNADRQRRREKWEADIGWGLEDEDELSGKVDDAIAVIEAICQPAVVGTPGGRAAAFFSWLSRGVQKITGRRPSE